MFEAAQTQSQILKIFSVKESDTWKTFIFLIHIESNYSYYTMCWFGG